MTDDTAKPSISSLRIHRDDDENLTRVRHPNHRSRLWLWLLPLTTVIMVIAVLFLRNSSGVIPVQTTIVQRQSPAAAQSLLTATGYVVAQRMAAVASKGTGRLERLNVEEGDQVRQGDVLARLEAEDVTAALQAARAAVAQAEAEVRRAEAVAREIRLTYARTVELFEKKLISQAEYDNAEARQASAEAQVAAAQAALNSARANADYAAVQVEYTSIRAPFDGTVLTKDADVGEVVAPFASSASSKGAVVTLADMSSLEVEANVSESNIQRIRPQQPCIITLDALPAEPYRGQVKKIVPTADRAKATVMVKVTFDRLDERVLPEMSAKVSFLPTDAAITEVQSILSVPLSALRRENGDAASLFVVRQGEAHLTNVETGRTYGGVVEIRSGVEAGETVVIYPPDDLADGRRVELQP